MMLSVNNELLNEKTGENPHFRLLLRSSYQLSPIYRLVMCNLFWNGPVNGRLSLSSAAHYRRGSQGCCAAALTTTSIMRRTVAK